MLFRKNQPKICSYCVHGTSLGEDQILCPKRGVRAEDDGCCRFKYDPCKRIPPKPARPDFEKFHSEDFSL